ncbi:L domain-like protein [Parathielavia appendiculata]|uniref:L domain-like protein n=1 Tax=Parathielavia appendiculata TaxID=2587402 RepID=A0AAN6Z122_9PEZI|nr:L domain-like protein [Parathielavia appendiculata]
MVSLPEEILELGDTLEHLDLSGTGLFSLPAHFGPALPKLKTALFSKCNFKVFPKALASCASLETVAIRSNGMDEIPENALPPRLRCLILTDNRLTSLPSTIGDCERLEQCMLAGNQLDCLPVEIARCKQLAVLRLSSNKLSTLPSWLFTLPELAFLSFANNPCASPITNGVHTPRGVASIAWSDLEVQQPLGSNTFQGLWRQSPHYAEDVAIKLFRGPLTSDEGTPADEMAACLATGAHESLITILGRIHNHPDEETTLDEEGTAYQGGIVTQLLPDLYAPLACQPPSHDDVLQSPQQQQQQDAEEPTQTPLDVKTALGILTGLAGCLAHLHGRGIAHGGLFAHNIRASAADAHAVLDLDSFRAATVYGHGSGALGYGKAVEKVEVLAFGRVMERVLSRVRIDAAGDEAQQGEVRRGMWEVQERCVLPDLQARPDFEEVVEALEELMGWRGMMRIPDVHP